MRHTRPPKLLEKPLLNRSVHRPPKLPLNASHNALISHAPPGRQLRVQRSSHGVKMARGGRGVSRYSVIAWRKAELLLLRRLLLLGAFRNSLSAQRSCVYPLPHQHDLLLQKLPLAVLETIKLPLPLGHHLSVERRLCEKRRRYHFHWQSHTYRNTNNDCESKNAQMHYFDRENIFCTTGIRIMFLYTIFKQNTFSCKSTLSMSQSTTFVWIHKIY